MGNEVFRITGTRICPICRGILRHDNYWMSSYPFDADIDFNTNSRHRRYCSLEHVKMHELKEFQRAKSSITGRFDYDTNEYYSTLDFQNDLAWDHAEDESIHVINGIPYANATGEVLISREQYQRIIDQARKKRWAVRDKTGWIPRHHAYYTR